MAARSTVAEARSSKLSSYNFRCLGVDEIPLVNDLYNRCYRTDRALAEADWKYRSNPYGEALILGAFDAQDRLVGVRPTVAWRFSWAGQERHAYQFTDALVAPEHRGNGIFSRLVRDLCALAAERDVSLFSFGPNSNSLPIYSRLGLLGRVARCRVQVKVLAWRKYIRYKLGHGISPAPSRHSDDEPAVTHGEASLLPIGRFQSDFEEVHAELGRILASFTLRRQDFLNWRFFEHPTRRYRVAIVQLRGQPQGYVAVRMMHHVAHVMDVFLRPTPAAVKALPRLLTTWARQMGAVAVYFDSSEDNIFASGFRRAGFFLQRRTWDIVLDTRSMRQLMPSGPSRGRDLYFPMADSDTT
jgi:GNAT superfamily N-acetyltransferase